MLKTVDPEAINKDQTGSGRDTMLKKIIEVYNRDFKIRSDYILPTI